MRRIAIPILLLMIAGCEQSKNIPLFNQEALLINRIYSGKELLTELNNAVARYVSLGWMTQAQVDAGVGRELDRAGNLLRSAEALHDSGQVGSVANVDAAAEILKLVRSQLQQIEKSRQQ